MPFITDDPNMLHEWLTVGPVSSLDDSTAERPTTARLLGDEISLWRDSQGAPHCQADSKELLIEAHYGYLWVCPSGTPARPLFAFPEYNESGRRIVDCGGFGVAVSGLRIVENFLDMAHFPYVHAHYLGNIPHTEVTEYKVQTDASTDEIWATDCRFWQPKSSASAIGGLEARYKYRVMQPFSTMLYKTSAPYPDQFDAIGLFVQPVDEVHSVAHCLLVYFDDETTDTELIAFQHTIFGQDKPILEGHVLKRIPLEGRLETPTRGDATSVAYRRWLKARGMRFGVLPV